MHSTVIHVLRRKLGSLAVDSVKELVEQRRTEEGGAGPSAADGNFANEAVCTLPLPVCLTGKIDRAICRHTSFTSKMRTCWQGVLDLTGDREFLVEETARLHLSPLTEDAASHWKVLYLTSLHFPLAGIRATLKR